jgi:hypothetical protein
LLDRALPGDVVAVMCHQDRDAIEDDLRGRGAGIDDPDTLRAKALAAMR